MNEPVIAVIGGGASGTLAAAHLAASGRPMRLLMVEPGQVGRGIAYATSDHRHRLNVPAGRMSAWADDPEHFVRWLRGHRHPCATAATYAARADYGSYLADVLRTVSQLPQVRLTVLAARAVALAEHHEGLLLSPPATGPSPRPANGSRVRAPPARSGSTPERSPTSMSGTTTPWSASPTAPHSGPAR
ncbi:FAD/NAD(P)-binding protein [Pseudonocardia sp. Cha107L01]|uniref:FAD/NAD(P)-binding protein n=1 Tax=Pseudonocardia sp. Cha107L01 TaxID=3457576 RepID=UPI00403E9EBE